MRARLCVSAFVLLFCQCVLSQEKNDDYRDGYALILGDTVKCKILDQNKHSFSTTVTIIVGDTKTTFNAGSSLKGFGFAYKNEEYHFGDVAVVIQIGTQTTNRNTYVKKLVAGIVSLYEHNYVIGTTLKKTVNGVEQPGTKSTNQNFTKYYISKFDRTRPGLDIPVEIYAYKKTTLEDYIGDNAELFNRIEKKLKLSEVIELIKEYNNWHKEKK